MVLIILSILLQSALKSMMIVDLVSYHWQLHSDGMNLKDYYRRVMLVFAVVVPMYAKLLVPDYLIYMSILDDYFINRGKKNRF